MYTPEIVSLSEVMPNCEKVVSAVIATEDVTGTVWVSEIVSVLVVIFVVTIEPSVPEAVYVVLKRTL